MVRSRIVAFVAVLATALAVGCTAAPPAVQTPAAATAAPATPAAGAKTAATPAATPKPNVPQTMTIIVPSVAGDLNPYNRGAAGGGAYLLSVFDPLFTIVTGTPEPVLAESWRNISPTAWEVRIKEARYTNGDTVTADDVKYAFDLGQDARESAAFTRTYVDAIESVQVIDPRTLRFTTKTPDPIFLRRLYGVPIFPARLHREQGGERFFNNPVGVGPYRITSFNPQQSVTMVPFDGYYGPKPILTQITMRAAPEPAARVAAIRSGEADIISTIVLDQIPELRGVARPVTRESPVMTSIYLDTNVPEFADRRVRLAMNQAIDRQTIVTQLFGDVVKPARGQPIIEGTYGYNPQVQPYAYDEAAARRLMQEAGFANGFAMNIGFTSTQATFRQAAEAIQPYLQRIGIRISLAPYDSAQFLAGFRTNRLGPMIVSAVSTSEFLDPLPPLSSFTMIPEVGSGRYRNPEFDRLYNLQATELDVARREGYLRDIMRLLHDDAPILPLWGFFSAWAVTDRVDGFAIPPTGFPDWTKVSRTR